MPNKWRPKAQAPDKRLSLKLFEPDMDQAQHVFKVVPLFGQVLDEVCSGDVSIGWDFVISKLQDTKHLKTMHYFKT